MTILHVNVSEVSVLSECGRSGQVKDWTIGACCFPG